VLGQCISYARPAGKILFFGVPPKGKLMTIEPFRLFNKELTIMSSYTSLRNSKQAIDFISVGRMLQFRCNETNNIKSGIKKLKKYSV